MPNYNVIPFQILLGLWQTKKIDSWGIAKFAAQNPAIANSAIQYAAFLGTQTVTRGFDPTLLFTTPFINIGTIAQYISIGDPTLTVEQRALIALVPFVSAGIVTLTVPAVNFGAAAFIAIVCEYMSKSVLGQMTIFPFYTGYALKKHEKLATLVVGNFIYIVVVRFSRKFIRLYKNLLRKSYLIGYNFSSNVKIRFSKLITRKRRKKVARFEASLF